MSTDFGQFFQDAIADKRRSEREEQERRADEQAEAKRQVEALAAPLDKLLTSVLPAAAHQLASHNVKLIRDPEVLITDGGDCKVKRFIRLERPRQLRGHDASSIYGFRVLDNGAVEGFIVRPLDNPTEGNNIRVSFATAAELTEDVVNDVLKAALTELAGEIHETAR